jgi:hypothetical protein
MSDTSNLHTEGGSGPLQLFYTFKLSPDTTVLGITSMVYSQDSKHVEIAITASIGIQSPMEIATDGVSLITPKKTLSPFSFRAEYRRWITKNVGANVGLGAIAIPFSYQTNLDYSVLGSTFPARTEIQPTVYYPGYVGSIGFHTSYSLKRNRLLFSLNFTGTYIFSSSGSFNERASFHGDTTTYWLVHRRDEINRNNRVCPGMLFNSHYDLVLKNQNYMSLGMMLHFHRVA